ncbi:uncharacterized protein LOC134258310 [Saccostrea cucullata]|uniref:uncharacterized protein LOC134258310 n=1 Tax=Saccostrea cuccullata TaxID=36930 RepID=UPI002ED5C5D5
MGTLISALRVLSRLLFNPICPSRQNYKHRNARHVAFLLFSHLISGLFVVISTYAAEQSTVRSANYINWAVVIGCVIVGLFSLCVLLVSGCRGRLVVDPKVCNADSDPSLNLRVIFLWMFGMTVMLHLALNIAIYLECLQKYSLNLFYFALSLLSNFAFMCFLIIQLSIIAYYRRNAFRNTLSHSIAVVFILTANFAIWFNTTVSTINVFEMMENKTVPRYSNESFCFRTSKIQVELERKIEQFLTPARMEFCILASSFIISLWTLPDVNRKDNMQDKDGDLNNSLAFDIQSRGRFPPGPENDSSRSLMLHSRNGVNNLVGSNIVSLVFGIILNLPSFVSNILLTFVFDWDSEKTAMSLYFSKCLGSVSIIVVIYLCSYNLRKLNFSWSKDKMTVNDYILIISSSGMVAYFMFGLLSPDLTLAFLSSRIFLIIETYLQTYFLIKMKRACVTFNSSMISATGVFLTISNLIYWFLNAYNQITFVKGRILKLVEFEDWLYIENVLVPLMTFYRFLSGMSAYSLYRRFKSHS